jgi:alpha-L-fucosidase
MLVDIVSRNGNLLLNFPLPNNGMLDPEELKILDEITKWMAVNSEAIYSTRPWKTHLDGGVTADAQSGRNNNDHHEASAFNERNRKELTAADIRFTQKNGALYVFAMGRPESAVKVPALAPGGQYQVGKIRNVEMLGAKGKLTWTQDASGLTIQSPPQTTDHAVVFKVTGV